MLRRKSSLITSILIGITVMMYGCGQGHTPVDAVSGNSPGGTAAIKMTASSGSPFSQIARSAEVKISAGDMTTMIRELSVNDTSVYGLIKGIPGGRDRLFEVFVYDSLDVLQYKGSATSDIFTDSTVVILLSVYRVGGSALINGQIIDEVSDTSADAGLLAHWSFDSSSGNTYFDVTGNGYDASSDGLSLTSGVKGKALSCPGKDFELVVQNSKEDFGLTQFTLETWFYSNTSISNYVKIFDYQKIESGVWNGYGIQILPNGKASFSCANGNSGWLVCESDSAIKPEVWYHIVCTFDGEYMKLYLNGALADTLRFTGMYALPDADARIACQTRVGGSNVYHVNGKIDEMKIYNHALDSTTIRSKFFEVNNPE